MNEIKKKALEAYVLYMWRKNEREKSYNSQATHPFYYRIFFHSKTKQKLIMNPPQREGTKKII